MRQSHLGSKGTWIANGVCSALLQQPFCVRTHLRLREEGTTCFIKDEWIQYSFWNIKTSDGFPGWPLCDTITLLLNLPFLFLRDFHWGKSCWKQQLFYKYYRPGSDCLPSLSIKCRLCSVKILCQGQYTLARDSLNILAFIALFGQNQITLPLLVRRCNLRASFLWFLLLVLLGISE